VACLTRVSRRFHPHGHGTRDGRAAPKEEYDVNRKVRELTDRQRQVLDHIVQVLREQGFPPTVREIADHFGMKSAFGIQRHLAALQKKGFLHREPAARAITLSPTVLDTLAHTEGSYPMPLSAPVNAHLVPVVGRVAAGLPITAEQNLEDPIPLPDEWLQGREGAFLLKVKGDSMAPGIEDGDMLLIQPQTTAENGTIVVAIIDGEATVKRFFRHIQKVVLRADNPAYEDIVTNTDLRLCGKVVSLIRHF